MKNKQKLLALLVAGTLAFGGLAGCGNYQEEEEEDEIVDIDFHKKKSMSSAFKSLGSSAKGSVSS